MTVVEESKRPPHRPSRRAARALAALLASALAACSPAPAKPTGGATPSVSPVLASAAATQIPTRGVGALTGRVVFTRAGGSYGDESVFIANIDGSDQQPLGVRGSTGGPSVARDFSRLAIDSAGSDGRFAPMIDLHDLTKQVQLQAPAGMSLNVGSGPFSPDGRWFAAEGFDDAKPALHGVYLLRTDDGGGLVRVVTGPFIPGDWSPDGTWLLLFKGGEGEPPASGSLWLVRPDGSDLHALTSEDRREVQCCFNYRFSPDGTKVLFAGKDGVIRTIDVVGSNLTDVFRAADGRYAITPAWSPDGTLIIFGLEGGPNPFSHPANALYVVRADGTGLTEVIGGTDFKREPNWISP